MVSLKKKRGFTLIELLVVITIIGILAVMPLNAFRKAYDRAQLRIAAERFLSILQEAKANAQSHSDTCYGVRLKEDSPTTVTIMEGSCDAPQEQTTESFYHNLAITSTSSEDVLFMPPHGMVYTPTDDVTWTIKNLDGLQAQVVLNVSLSTLSLTTIPS